MGDAVWRQTAAHLLACLPQEGVGLWSGPGTAVATWTPLANVAANPRVRYAVHPQQWIDALRDAELRGERPIALVHSHPTAEVVPSQRDTGAWHYQELWCVIVSFAQGTPEWRAYQLKQLS